VQRASSLFVLTLSLHQLLVLRHVGADPSVSEPQKQLTEFGAVPARWMHLAVLLFAPAWAEHSPVAVSHARVYVQRFSTAGVGAGAALFLHQHGLSLSPLLQSGALSHRMDGVASETSSPAHQLPVAQ
jgi:hypothetical protein